MMNIKQMISMSVMYEEDYKQKYKLINDLIDFLIALRMDVEEEEEDFKGGAK